MAQQEINIVSFDVPYPPDYGGVIDVFNKIVALSGLGIKIHLHCFKYGRKEARQLEKYCVSVHYYERKLRFIDFFSKKPFIIKTRNSKKLLQNLNMNRFPILFEGLHSTFFLNHKSLKKRLKIVRAHNIEHDYYFALAKHDKHPLKRIYFLAEALKLKYFEKNLANADTILPISENDFNYFSKNYKNTIKLAAFHDNIELSNAQGKGKYILFHAHLSVADNEKAALYLIETVFSKIQHKVKIAGKNPSPNIIDGVKKYRNIELLANVPINEMPDLINNAQIIVLYTFQATGIKLKLLNSLFQGRFCIANSKMLAGTGLAGACVVANTESEIVSAIDRCFFKEFDEGERAKRRLLLQDGYSNEKNAQKIFEIIDQGIKY